MVKAENWTSDKMSIHIDVVNYPKCIKRLKTKIQNLREVWKHPIGKIVIALLVFTIVLLVLAGVCITVYLMFPEKVAKKIEASIMPSSMKLDEIPNEFTVRLIIEDQVNSETIQLEGISPKRIEGLVFVFDGHAIMATKLSHMSPIIPLTVTLTLMGELVDGSIFCVDLEVSIHA